MAVRSALTMAIVGTIEMAGLASRWDRWYLKSYEAMSNHRFNVTTFAAEPNVMGAAIGRGTVRKRIALFKKAASWVADLSLDTQRVDGPLKTSIRRRRQRANVNVRVVEGSSERMLTIRGELDAVVTDPPYHDDVHYGELSLPFRAWAGLHTDGLDREAIVSERTGQNGHAREYRDLLNRIFSEIQRSLRADGHLIFTYANRDLGAWKALFSALAGTNLMPVGYHIVHAENETDHSKAGRRSLTYDLLMDLVNGDGCGSTQWRPASVPDDEEGCLLQQIGECFLAVRTSTWETDLLALAGSPFLAAK